MARNSRYDYLIVGNSAAGIAAAESIRELDGVGSLAIVSDEPYHAYSRPLISHYLAGDKSAKSLNYRENDFYGKLTIEPMLGTKAVKISDGALDLESGKRLFFKKLLLATGGKPFIPPLKGLSLKGVYSFTKLADARAISEDLKFCRKAVVLGGGLIGIKAAEALRERGIDVTVVELAGRVLSLVLDAKGSAMVEKSLRDRRVKMITGKTIQEIKGETRVESVILTDGTSLECDLLLVAIGVVPNTDLAKTAGLKTRSGIVVNGRMESSANSIYAAGDAVELMDFVLGRRRPIPVLPLAYLGGRVAGANMAGARWKIPHVTSLNSAVFFGLPVASAGIVSTDGSPELNEVSVKREPGCYKKLVLNGDRLVGFVLVGDIDRGGIFLDLMRKSVEMKGWKKLICNELTLISLPASAAKEKIAEMCVP